jgi:hypothetical protein
MTTVIKYGISNELPSRSFEDGYTVGELIADKTTLAFLNAPEGCAAVSAGETLDNSDCVNEYSVITLEKQASNKAS